MAQVVVEMSGDEAKLWRSMARILGQQQKTDQAWKRIKTSSRDAERASRQASQTMARGLVSVGRSAMGVVAGMQAVREMQKILTDGIGEMNKAADEAAGRLQKVEDAAISMSLVGETPGDIRRMRGEVDALAQSIGVTRAELFQLREAADNASQPEAFTAMGRAAEVMGTEIVKATSAAASAALGGTIPQALALSRQAQMGTPFTASQMLGATPQAGQFRQLAGARQTEIAAALNVLGQAGQAPTQAATMLTDIMSKATQTEAGQEMGLAGMGFTEILERIAALSQEERRERFGADKQFNSGIALLSQNMEEYSRQLELMRAAEQDPMAVIARMVAVAEASTPELIRRRERVTAENVLAMRSADFGTAEQHLQNIENRIEAGMMPQVPSPEDQQRARNFEAFRQALITERRFLGPFQGDRKRRLDAQIEELGKEIAEIRGDAASLMGFRMAKRFEVLGMPVGEALRGRIRERIMQQMEEAARRQAADAAAANSAEQRATADAAVAQRAAELAAEMDRAAKAAARFSKTPGTGAPE